MGKWQAKLADGDYSKSTPKTPKSTSEPDSRVTGDFLRLVRIIGACERGLLLDDEIILAELDADDLSELAESSRSDRQAWAQMLAHRLCTERLRKGPRRHRGKGGSKVGGTPL